MLIQHEIDLGGGAHCRRNRKPRRTTNCVLHSLGSLEDEIGEKVQGDMSKPRKVHCKSEWKRAQDVANCIHSDKAQEKDMTFWQTKSLAIIDYTTVPPDCIERVISKKSETIFCLSDSLHQGQLREYFSKMLGISCSSNSSSRVIWKLTGN